MKTCIDLVENAHRLLQINEADQPLRTALYPSQAKGILATMPAFIGGDNQVIGLKAVTVFPGNQEFGMESHQGAIMLINPENGTLMAVLDAAEITAMRTAAASAVATKYLARKDALTLALLGAGVQAHSHLLAMHEVMNLEHVRIWNRTAAKAESFSNTYSDQFSISAASLDEALEADVICTLTHSGEPLFDIEDIKQGAHINAVGASQATTRELGPGFISNAVWFTDVYESAANEAGAILIPKRQGEIEELPLIVELGALVNRDHPGRINDTEITIYKSLGVGIQDLVCAQFVFSEAEKQGLGTLVAL